MFPRSSEMLLLYSRTCFHLQVPRIITKIQCIVLVFVPSTCETNFHVLPSPEFVIFFKIYGLPKPKNLVLYSNHRESTFKMVKNKNKLKYIISTKLQNYSAQHTRVKAKCQSHALAPRSTHISNNSIA